MRREKGTKLDTAGVRRGGYSLQPLAAGTGKAAAELCRLRADEGNGRR